MDIDDVTDQAANHNSDEVDAPIQHIVKSKVNHSISRIIPQDEGVPGLCISDIQTFKRDLFVYPVTKIDH